MNEQELRDGLRGEMVVASSQPSPMNVNSALDHARRAHKRRRARWTGAGAGLAVVALAAGAVLTLARPDGGGATLPIEAANGPQQPAPPAAADPTKPSLPDGQTDRTATSGPQAAKGSQLLQALTAAIPATLTVNTTLTYPDSSNKITASEAQFVDRVAGKEIWLYRATAVVNAKATPQGGAGRVMAEVSTPGNTQPTDVCDAAKAFWGIGGTCAVRQIQGKQVGVITTTTDPRIGQIAAYRHDDGTVVQVAQTKSADNDTAFRGSTNKGLAELPLTVDQLAGLALNPAFRIG